MAYPNVDVYLDSGLIPSLGGGSIVGHHALMGRPILPTLPPLASSASNPVKATKPLSIPPKRTQSGEGGKRSKVSKISEEDGELTARPAKVSVAKGQIGRHHDGAADTSMKRPHAHRRTSSMDGSMGKSGSHGAKAGLRVKPVNFVPISHIPRRLPHLPASIPSANSAPQPGQYLAPPPLVKRPPLTHKPLPRSPTHLSPPPLSARHARSSSWSTPETGRPSCIPLSPTSKHDDDPVDLLVRLHELIPPARLDPLAPPPSSSTLHPPTLLAGLAFILEALVAERQLLSFPTEAPTKLPLLRDRTSLQSKTHELDWAATHKYLTSFGAVLEGLMGLLMDSEVSEEKLGLVEMVKTYVDKTRKVFGEVAGLYMDSYSCMEGWWDEEGMRGSAREVGRWGELVGIGK